MIPALAPPTGQHAFPQNGQAELIEKSPANPTNHPENLSAWPGNPAVKEGFFSLGQHADDSRCGLLEGSFIV
jgi:hypothetical protein